MLIRQWRLWIWILEQGPKVLQGCSKFVVSLLFTFLVTSLVTFERGVRNVIHGWTSSPSERILSCTTSSCLFNCAENFNACDGHAGVSWDPHPSPPTSVPLSRTLHRCTHMLRPSRILSGLFWPLTPLFTIPLTSCTEPKLYVVRSTA
jgi:hypothetical protein